MRYATSQSLGVRYDECGTDLMDPHFHCNVCDIGNFDLCQGCVGEGLHCYVPQHKLLKRVFKDGSFIHVERWPGLWASVADWYDLRDWSANSVLETRLLLKLREVEQKSMSRKDILGSWLEIITHGQVREATKLISLPGLDLAFSINDSTTVLTYKIHQVTGRN